MEAGLPSGSTAGWAHSSGEIPVQAGKRGERGSAWAPWWAPTTLPKPPQAAKGICCLLGRDNTGTVPEPDPRGQGKAGMGGQMDGGWMDGQMDHQGSCCFSAALLQFPRFDFAHRIMEWFGF